jgi:phage-related holin
MKFGDAFTYVFQDPDWFKKVIIPGLIGVLLPIIGQMVLLGWGLKVTLNVVRNNPNPLPNMDFGGDLGRGFKAWVVSLVYGIPMFVFYLPIMIFSIIASESGEQSMAVVAAIAGACFGFLMLLYGILMGLLLPAAYARVAVEDTIGAGLAFKEVFNMVKKNLVTYLLILVGTLAASFISSLGSIACVIGIFLTVPYATAILGHLYGQGYLEAKNLETV